jgi:hypothetical protein
MIIDPAPRSEKQLAGDEYPPEYDGGESGQYFVSEKGAAPAPLGESSRGVAQGSSPDASWGVALPDPTTFSRPPAPGLPYDSFPPIYLIANGKYLEQGFPLVPPPSPKQPHPFVTHDVNEADWSR